MSLKLTGSMVALVTPFKEDLSVDWEGFERLIEHQLSNGTSALIVCGTTGEAATMTPDERLEAIKFVVEKTKGRVPVVAGTGSTSTRVALELSKQAKEAGADAFLIVTPPYNKPTQEGLIDYYTTIADQLKWPIVLYNVPGRTCSNLLPETAAKLADNPNIIAIKDATADMNVGSRIVELCGDKLTLLSGDDFTALPLLSIGGDGWISVTANLVPDLLAEMYSSWKEGNIAKAREIHYRLLPLHRAMFLKSNPIPAKTALSMMGICQGHLRSPLVPMDEESTGKLKSALLEFGIKLAE